MKKIFVGLEGSGKSLQMAKEVFEIANRNAKWYLKTNTPRPIWINTPLNPDFVQKCSEMNVPIVYWENLSELVGLNGVDLFIDEIGTYFDSRNYAELSLNVRRWFAQADKSDVDIYGTAQDYAQIDVAFRRLVNDVYHIKKFFGSHRPHATKPETNYFGLFPKIWGIHLEIACNINADEPSKLDKDIFSYFFGWFVCHKKYCDLYNTGAFVKMSKGVPLQHSERSCPDCGFNKTFHT